MAGLVPATHDLRGSASISGVRRAICGQASHRIKRNIRMFDDNDDELLKSIAGIDMLHVPFKGSGPAYPEVMSGRIPLLIDPLFSSLSHIKAGKLKPIAVTSAKREGMAPDIATFAETLPGFNVQSISGMVVPGATPREIVRRLNADVIKVLQLPEMAKRMAEFGLTPVGNSPEEFEAIIRSEIDRWGKVVKAAGIKAE